MADNDDGQLARGVALGILTVLLGSTVAAAGKHLSDQVPVATIVIAQYGICFVLTLPWLLRNGSKGLATKHPWAHLLRGVSGCACFYTYYLALQHIPLVDATLLRNTAPLMVPLVVLLWQREGLGRGHWPPLLLGFAGIALVLRPSLDGISVWHLVGLSSGLGLAISMVGTRVLAGTEPESRILFYYFSISLLAALPFYAADYQPIPATALPWLLYIGAAMYFTFVLYTRAYRYVSASRLAPTSYFGVVFAGALDWLIWAHVPDAITLAGIACVVAGGVMVLRGR